MAMAMAMVAPMVTQRMATAVEMAGRWLIRPDLLTGSRLRACLNGLVLESRLHEDTDDGNDTADSDS